MTKTSPVSAANEAPCCASGSIVSANASNAPPFGAAVNGPIFQGRSIEEFSVVPERDDGQRVRNVRTGFTARLGAQQRGDW